LTYVTIAQKKRQTLVSLNEPPCRLETDIPSSVLTVALHHF